MKKYDPLLPHKTRAGINWIQDGYFAPMKICVGQHITKQSSLNGWYGKPNLRRLEELIGDRMPWAYSEFKKTYTGGSTFGHILSRRAAYCLPPERIEHGKNELLRFKEPIFQATWNAIAGNEVLQMEYILYLQEKRTQLENAGLGGVYIRWNPETPQVVYVGSTEDIADRNHNNQPLYLWDFFALSDIKLAENIETLAHDFLRENGYSMKGPRGRGLFKVHSGNARDMVVEFLKHYYGRIFHSYGGCKIP